METNVDEIRIEQEIKKAEKARESGNEGMARVCARRAVGIAIGNYFKRKGYPDPSNSAYDLLRDFCHTSDTPAELRQVASHFLIRVNPDHHLPLDIDLISEARWLITQLSHITDSESNNPQERRDGETI